MIETGTTPRDTLKENPLLRRALTLLNRMDAGIQYRAEDLGYRELKAVEIVQAAINEAERNKMRELRSRGGGGDPW